jgi:hypothetical protein
LAFLYLPPSLTQTKSTGIKGILRGKSGWFTEREEVVMVTRFLRDDPGKSTMYNVSLDQIEKRVCANGCAETSYYTEIAVGKSFGL